MTNEQAQRLVAMSLSKIQNARSKRTGLNLQKSLLVSSVLFKAKTAIIMAKYNMKSEYESGSSTEYFDDTTDDDEEEEQIQGDASSMEQQQEDDDAQVVPDLDTDNESDSCVTDNENIYDYCAEEDKENSPPTTKDISDLNQSVECNTDTVTDLKGNMSSNTDLRCNKCSKRRLTEVESAVESITKKQCTDEDNVYSSASVTTETPMECGQQMATLVDSFSHCGFSGLLSVNHSYNTTQSSDNDATRGSSNSTQGQTGSLSDAFNSCSTQIKESFDTLSSPIMLSV